MNPLASIVIPAHNEAAVIDACLRELLDDVRPGEFDVVVVANACTDATAELAGKFNVRVLETPAAGKANALRLGDAACDTFPRVYIDADVGVTAASVRALVAASQRPGVLACAPVPVLDVSDAGPVARRLHRVHEQLIAPQRGLAGVGVYVLTEEGHARAFPIPDLISDDGWMHGSFTADERVVVTEACSVVRPARTVRAHLRRRVRVRQGNRQLAERGRAPEEGRLTLGSLLTLVRRRAVSPLDAGCYLGVVLADRGVTQYRSLRGGRVQWGSDTSSR